MTKTNDFIHQWVQGSSQSTLLLLHGTGGDESDLIGLGKMLDPGASLLSPRGKALERGMPRFFRRFAEGVFDLEDLHARTDELADWVGAAAAQYGFDAAQVTAIGYSNGANIAASLLLERPATLAHAILFRAMMPFEPESSPALAKKRIFMSNGRRDPIIPLASAERLAEVFRTGGAEVTLRLSNGGHGLEQPELDAAREWLQPEKLETGRVEPVRSRR